MKYFIYLLSLFIVIPCFITKAQSTGVHKKRDEQWAVAQISALPEVKTFIQYAKKSDPLVMIAGDPDSTRKYYWVKVGISNFNMFRTSDDFLVDPKTSEIYFWDIALELEKGDKTATLKQWRKWRSDPRFWKPHTFRNGKLVALTK